MQTRTMCAVLAEAARIIREVGGGSRVRRLRAEIDLLRSAVALDVGPEELVALERLVAAVYEEAHELRALCTRAREAAIQMMD